MNTLPKQNADQSNGDASRDQFNADELAEQGSYDSSTEVAQRMRRGDETKGDPDERDEAGAGTGIKGDNQNMEK
jgi:hypothetical protein